ncbi:MAG: DUF6603 domain-containing protein, partial [Chloroflexota bacterium]
TIPSLGLRLPPTLADHSQVLDAVDAVGAMAQSLGESVTTLDDAIADEDPVAIIAGGLAVITALAGLIEAITTLAQQLDDLAGSLGGLTAPERAEVQAFAAELPRKLLDYFLIQYLEALSLPTVEVLNLIGLLEKRREEGLPGDPLNPPYLRRTLHIERLQTMFENPAQHLQDLYDWGSPTFDGQILFDLLQELFDALDLPVDILETGGVKTLEAYVFSLTPNTTTSPPSLDLKVRIPATEDLDTELPVVSIWSTRLTLAARFEAGLEGNLSPPFTLSLGFPTAEAGLDLALGIVGQDAEGPLVIFGVTGGSRVEAQKLAADIGLSLGFSADGATAEPLIGAAVEGGKLVVDLSGGDGFITEVVSAQGIEGNFDLKALWQASAGLAFEGSGGVEIAIPTHISLGPIELQNFYIILAFTADPPVKLETSVAFKANLGPLQAVIDRMGAEARLRFPADNDGNLGPLDLTFAFKAPSGVGLSIDAAVVKGGGFLRFDPDKEQYDGILELDLSGIVSVKAIALITTRLPDGSKGFSLLLIITAEFGSPIQLGLGFTLSAVGGLLGLNRTMRLEVIATGIRDGGINSIMFPQNVVENASRIISDLKNYFPVEDGTFLIGPMVKIGWGTPNLVTVSLGIIIEIPGNIAILGVLKVVLPDEEAALIVIQVNFIGAIEFDKKRLWFFAAIFDSRILFITLEGEMGLLVGWGDDASFVVSVGGFHPAFNPPPLPFGAIARIAISILNTDFARIRIEGYFAVTSNSVQFGAAVELYFGLDAFNIDGHLAFDALFRFSPFYFIITISASLSVKVFGVGLFSVRMRGSLEGPTPWHVEGTGSISLLFFDIDVDFSHTWGSEAETTLPPISVMPLLVDEYQKSENWLATLPAANQLLVSLRSAEATADLILHPVGSLKVSQRAVPLGLTIDKVGNQKPSDANRFDVSISSAGIDERGAVEESFAVGQYFDKSDDALLNAKSFEPMKGGLELSVAGEQVHAPQAVRRIVRYEKIIVDTHFERFVQSFFTWVGALFSLFLNGNAVSKATISYKQQKALKPFEDKVEVGVATYAVTFNSDNTAYNQEALNFTSQVQAEEFMKQQVATDPNLAKELHVIPQVEMQGAE